MTVKRIDSHAGWGMHLAFNCRGWGGSLISVGSSHHHNSKMITVDNIGKISDVCPHVVDHNNWNGEHGSWHGAFWWKHFVPYGDRFQITGSDCL